MKKAMKATFSLFCLVIVVLGLMVLTGCDRNTVLPTPVITPTPAPTCNVSVVVNGDGSVTVNGCGNNVTAPGPSPSPATKFPIPDYIKITMYGDQRCPA